MCESTVVGGLLCMRTPGQTGYGLGLEFYVDDKFPFILGIEDVYVC